MGNNVKPEHTLGVIEAIIEGKAEFSQWGNLSDVEIMHIDGFDTNLGNEEYKHQFIARMHDRLNFIKSRDTEKGGMDKLPPDAAESLERVLAEI